MWRAPESRRATHVIFKYVRAMLVMTEHTEACLRRELDTWLFEPCTHSINVIPEGIVLSLHWLWRLVSGFVGLLTRTMLHGILHSLQSSVHRFQVGISVVDDVLVPEDPGFMIANAILVP